MPAKGSMIKHPKGAKLISTVAATQYAKQTGRKDVKRFREIGNALFEQIAKWIVEDEEGFKLPYNMGILVVKRYTPRKKPINRKKSLALGQTVYYHNRHSFGDIITTTWIKPERILYRNLKAYCYKPDRDHVKRPSSRQCLAGKIYKKIPSRDRYVREMTALDNIQEQYEDKVNKQQQHR